MVPNIEEGDLDLIKRTKIDLLGINYYRPRRVKAKEYIVDKNGIFMPEWFFDSYEMPGRRMNRSRGIEIYPKGIYDIAVMIKEKYNNIPWFVSENGIGIEGEDKFIENGMVQEIWILQT